MGENVDHLVDNVLRSPALRTCIENCLNNATVPASSVVTLPPVCINSTESTPRSNTNNVGTTTSVREELRRLFPSIRPRPSSSSFLPSSSAGVRATGNKRKRYTCKERKPVFKEVILLTNPRENKTLIGIKKAKAYDDGFALSAVTIEKNWNYTELCTNIEEQFGDKLVGKQYEFLVPVSGYLVKPNLNNNQELDGETLSKIYCSKSVYVRLIKEDSKPKMDCFVKDDAENSISINTNEEINHFQSSSIEENYEVDINLVEPTSLKDILNKLSENIYLPEEKITTFHIYREDIFNCCLRALQRKSFSPHYKINVLFTDCDNGLEGAVDAGGPQREMFRLIFNYLGNSSCLFAGPSNSKFITLDKEALENNLYFEAGRLIALAIAHVGFGPRFFSELFFTLLTQGPDNIEPTVNDINNPDIKAEIDMAVCAANLQTLRNIILEGTYIRLAGWEIINEIEKKDVLIKDVIKFYVLERCFKSLHQFEEGLKTLEVYDYIKKYPEYFVEVMCHTREGVLTLKEFQKKFDIKYSEAGSNRRNVESRIIAHWSDYVLECDENDNQECEDLCTLEEILIFSTALNIIPPLGFELKPTIQFLHSDSCPYPRGNTCSLELHLPTVHLEYEKFKYYMTYGIKNGMVFGCA